ncbi:MAG: hypothetical protein JKY54_09815, partial [Flavobacteriales bacterium]|nr:hypothetical protein [Flavobacteriales bacterium]
YTKTQGVASVSTVKLEADTVATYFYSQIDTLYLNDSSNPYYKFLFIQLTLFDDDSFDLDNENIECFANLPDYSGEFEMNDSILTCKYNAWVFSAQKHPDHKMEEHFYTIRGDTLISLDDPEIKLVKQI